MSTATPPQAIWSATRTYAPDDRLLNTRDHDARHRVTAEYANRPHAASTGANSGVPALRFVHARSCRSVSAVDSARAGGPRPLSSADPGQAARLIACCSLSVVSTPLATGVAASRIPASGRP